MSRNTTTPLRFGTDWFNISLEIILENESGLQLDV